MAKLKNSFIKGMNQDTSKSKYDNNNYYKGTNIKVLTEEGLSSGNIENEDGNILSFNIPDIPAFWKVRFNNPEDPIAGTFQVDYLNNNTLFTSYVTASVSSIEDLVTDLNTGLSALIGVSIKIIRNGEFVYIIPLDSSIVGIKGWLGLSVNDGSYEVEAQSNLKIIGWTTLRDNVILFTTNETSATPNSAGQIWKFKYDPVTKIIDNIGANNTLTVPDHLIYNNNLNFSTYWHIGTEAIGHYENSKTGRIYWTDEYNNLRTANVLDPNLAGKSPSDLNITEGIDMSIPVVTAVRETGTLPDGAVIQYAYRLFSTGGRYSTFSPVTNPIPLAPFDPSSDITPNRAYETYGGSYSTGNKSVYYTVSNIDTSFQVIEHIAIVTVGTSTSIYKFAETDVPSDGNVEVIHTNKGLDIPITPEEFAFLTRSFKRCKTITIKDKRLIAANVDTEDTTLDGFDTRAYRFSALSTTPAIDRKAYLTDRELTSITLNGSSPIYTSVPEEHDATNPYNSALSDADAVMTSLLSTSNRFKYKADGITLGGEGPNISYTFTTQPIPLKKSWSGRVSNFPNPTAFPPTAQGSGEYNTIGAGRNKEAPIYGTPSLNNEVRGNGDEFQNFKSPTMTGAFTGYARGETYRFGVAFYDKEGNPFNVKWIGDIRFPESYENVGGSYPYAISGTPISNPFTADEPILGQSIGIEFNLDVSSIQDKISGYEIVRVERLEQDKTRLGTGIWNNFTNDPVTHRRLSRSYVNGNRSSFLPYLVLNQTQNTSIYYDDDIKVYGDLKSCFTISDIPKLGNGDAGAATTGVIISPTSLMRANTNYSWRSGDRLRHIGFYKDRYEAGSEYQFVNVESGSNDNSVVGYNNLGGYWTPSASRQTVEIVREQILYPGQIITAGFNGPNNTNKKFINCSPSMDNQKKPAGIGDTKQIVDINTAWTELSGEIGSGVPDVWLWKEVSYERPYSNSYGGSTYEARSNNAYIATGSYESLKEYSQSSRTRVVFGGDTYVTQFHYQYYYMNGFGGDAVDGLDSAGTDVKYHLGFSFPCETSINTEYMTDGHYGGPKWRDWFTNLSGMGGIGQGPATYSISDHYRKMNNVKAIFYPKGFINNTVEEFPHRIWASENKIDGELLDSWRVFLINNYTEVEGQYGQINKITTLKDKFFFFQDRSFGVASINDRSVINDENGVALTVGSGGILDDFGYISRNTGTRHKLSVVVTGNSIHFFDAILKKWMRYEGSTNPISDIKGLHSHFLKINGNLLKSDRLLEGKGVHGIFDRVRNKVHMTFLSAELTSGISSGDLSVPDEITNYSIQYNENIQAIEQFSDCIPSMYLETDGKILTVESTNNLIVDYLDRLKAGYLHYEGDKNKFYGVIYPSIIELIISTRELTSIFDNIEYKSEIFINDIDQSNLTFDTIQVLNDHQNSGIISLTPNANVIRKLRTWRLNIPRDNSTNNPRMRDYFIKLILTHTPNNNERLILHDIETSFRPSPH